MRQFQRVRWSSVLLAVALAGFAGGVIAQPAGDSVPVTLAVTSGDNQTVSVGTVLPVAFSLRATDPSGAPIAGLAVGFAINNCYSFPELPPTCPPLSLYGEFDGNNSAIAISDANGVAVAPQFEAGTINGSYEVLGLLDNQQVGGVDYTPAPSNYPLFHVTQTGGASIGGLAVPALGVWAATLASLLIGLCGASFSRMRCKPRS